VTVTVLERKRLSRTLVDARAAFGAQLVVDYRVVIYGDRFGGAHVDAGFARRAQLDVYLNSHMFLTFQVNVYGVDQTTMI